MILTMSACSLTDWAKSVATVRIQGTAGEQKAGRRKSGSLVKRSAKKWLVKNRPGVEFNTSAWGNGTSGMGHGTPGGGSRYRRLHRERGDLGRMGADDETIWGFPHLNQ